MVTAGRALFLGSARPVTARRVGRPHADVLKHAAFLAIGEVQRDRQVQFLDIDAGRGVPQRHNLLGVRIRQRLQQYASITLKIAVVAPIPQARVSTLTVVNPGFVRSLRAANRRSRERRAIAFSQPYERTCSPGWTWRRRIPGALPCGLPHRKARLPPGRPPILPGKTPLLRRSQDRCDAGG